MSDAEREAPLYVQSMRVAQHLIEQFGRGPRTTLSQTLERDGVRLMDHITLALKGFDREVNIDEADATLALLRAHLRLALDLDLIEEQPFVRITRELDEIGRQIGGWQRRIESRE